MNWEMNRRKFNALLGMGALTTTLASSGAFAQAGGRLVLGGWGGDTQRLMEKYVIEPYLTPAGINTAYDAASEAQRKTKILAERGLPRGSIDVAGVQPPTTFELKELGVLEQLDQDRIPNFSRIIPTLKSDYAIPHIYTTRVILYNPNFVKETPKGYADLWNPDYAGRVGVIDIQYASTLESATLAAGGTVSDYEPGKEKLLELKKSGVKVYPSNEALAQGLASGEIWICIMWQARGVMWKDAGIPIEIAYPEEGLALSVFEYVIPRNARNKDAAYAFLNGMLEESAQLGHAEEFSYNGSLSDLALPENVSTRIAVPEAYRDKLLTADLLYLQQNDFQLKEWWDKVFKA